MQCCTYLCQKRTHLLVLLQDPNARNCHGYRKFVKRSVLENLNNGYLVNDTIVIKYTIELVVSTGGALTRQAGPSAPKMPLIQVQLQLLPKYILCRITLQTSILATCQ